MKKYLLALLVGFGFLAVASHAQAQVIVIANNSVKTNEISKADLKDIFTGASTSLKDGSHVVPILLKGGTAQEEFLKAYIGKSDETFRAGWRSLVFSGQASMPKSFDPDVAVVDFVAHNPGAIGYIRATTPHEGVKVLTVK